MARTIAILQPGYLPWLGFFEQMYRSDVFVIYDDVQYDKNGWRNRNRIKTASGAQWLTVPVIVKGKPKISEVLIDNTKNWSKKHLQAIKTNYAKAPNFTQCFSLLVEILEKKWDRLVDLDVILIKKMAEILGLKREIVLSSELGITGGRIDRLIKICQYFKADVFYEGAAGKNYINEKDFLDAGIKIEFQDYQHPIYKQLFGDFIPYLSIIDLLFNEGDKSLEIITKNSLPRHSESPVLSPRP